MLQLFESLSRDLVKQENAMRPITRLVLFSILNILAVSGIATTASAETYSYDAQGRVTQVVTDDGHTITYAYDGAGNRITVSVV
jgi:YD repeat-containing protein